MSNWPYYTVAWKRLRIAHLSMSPLCIGCTAMGKLVQANSVDHVVAISDGGHAFPGHEGLASYCVSCHSAKTARGPEAGAIRTQRPRRGCADDGTPYDAAHPWNGGDGRLPEYILERRMPTDLKPSRIPLTIVTGPPGAGKSTYVREHAGPKDLIICLDAIMQKLAGVAEHHTPAYLLPRAMDKRNAMLRALAKDTKHAAAWFIVSAPVPAERRKWAQRLGAKLVVIDTQLPECVRRIKADPTRTHATARMIETATKWWAQNPQLVRRFDTR